MTAENQIIRMHAGDTKKIETVLKRRDGSAYNFEGGAAIWQFLKNSRSGPSGVIASKVIEPTDVELFNDNGVDYYRVKTTLDPADSDGMDPGTYFHRCTIKTVAQEVYTVTTGPWIIEAGLPSSELP